MSRQAFLDTSAIYALAVPLEFHHGSALTLFREPNRTFLSHTLILTETFSLLAKRQGKNLALNTIAALRNSSKVEVVAVTPELLEAAWQRCLRYADKEWDWIDCVSFELMERRGVRDALSLDRHFAQAGFAILTP